jgi:very-short-patch-repair endonuclease
MKYYQIKEITRRLRKNPTKYEEILWRKLRRKQLKGRKFLRQHAVIYDSVGTEHFFYVPDFYCPSEQIAVEVDGEIHQYTKKRDARRDEILRDMKIEVLRFANQEIIDDMENVLKRIMDSFDEAN